MNETDVKIVEIRVRKLEGGYQFEHLQANDIAVATEEITAFDATSFVVRRIAEWEEGIEREEETRRGMIVELVRDGVLAPYVNVKVGSVEVHLLPPGPHIIPSFGERLNDFSQNERKTLIRKLEMQIDSYSPGDCPTVFEDILKRIKENG